MNPAQKKSAFYCLAGVIFGVISCETEPLGIEVEQVQPQIVVASQVIPDQFMAVGLTRSFGALDIDTEKDTVTSDFLSRIVVDSAIVTISYLGLVDTLFMLVDGIYVSLNTLQYPNEQYSLDVLDLSDSTRVFATTEMLPFVGFDSVEVVVNRSGQDTTVTIQYQFTDPPGENWYMLNYYRKYGRNSIDSLPIDTTDLPANFDINSYFDLGSNLLVETQLLTDKTFGSARVTGSASPLNIRPTDSIAVALSNISEEYYDFLHLRNQSQDWYSTIFNEPVHYPTNVINGLGYFNTHYPDVHFFDLNER